MAEEANTEVRWVRAAEFARAVEVNQSAIHVYLNPKNHSVSRIPEAYRDEDGFVRIPLRRCVVPSLHPRSYGNISKWFLTKEDVEQFEPELRARVIGEYYRELGYETPEGDVSEQTQEPPEDAEDEDNSDEGTSRAEEGQRESPRDPPEQREDGWVYTDSYTGPDGRESTAVLSEVRSSQTSIGEVLDKERLRQHGIDLDALGHSDDVEGFGIVVFFTKPDASPEASSDSK